MDSPRRSPRISTRASLEGLAAVDRPMVSPLAARSLAHTDRNPSPKHLPVRKHQRASTSGDPSSPDGKQFNKLARRAYSVGGAAFGSIHARNLRRDDVSVPSRRNVPGPRKSAIRTLPPQVFLSPSELSPPHSTRPLFSRKSLGLEAFGGTDLMKMMETIGIIRSPRSSNLPPPSTERLLAKMPRKSAPAAGPAMDDEVKTEDKVAVVERTRRRVTFNPFQEKANFEKDEPTMRIRPASEADQIPAETSASDTSASTLQSSTSTASDSSDMSLESASERSDATDEAEDSSESEAEVEDHLSTAMEEDDTVDGDGGDHTVTMEEESAMDMTSAYGGVQNSSTMTGITYGFTTVEDEDSDSAVESESETDEVSATMQLTDVQSNGGFDNTALSNISAGVGMDSEMEVEEEDDVEKQLEEPIVPARKEATEVHMTPREDDEGSVEMDITEVSQRSPDKTEDLTMASRWSNSPMKRESPSKRAPFSPRKSQAPPPKAQGPLQSRLPPNNRVSRSPSPEEKQSRGSTSILPSPRRRSTLHEREPSSPRRGHEHCKHPASQSPKPRVSLATLRSQARRATSPSPRKSIAASLRTSIGQAAFSSPEKLPFRASTSRQDKDEFVNHSLPPGPKIAAPEVKRPTTPPTPLPASPARRSSSPLRPPNSPSRAWQSFRNEQRSPTMPASPARRISMPSSAMNGPFGGGAPTTFGSPQRIALKTESERSPNDMNPEVRQTSSPQHKQPGLTMKNFFDSLDLGFLDLSLPAKRRMDTFASATKGTVGERMKVSCVTVPALDSLVDACKELKESVDDGRGVLSDLEREFSETPPSYVAEVMAMESTQERQKAIASFKTQKSAARAIALRAYYGWRTDKQFDDATMEQLAEAREIMDKDVEKVRRDTQVVRTATLPLLRQRRSALRTEVERVRSRQQDIAGWDAEEMQAMHEAMNEQNVVLQEQRAAHAETKHQLDRLLSRIHDVDGRRRAAEEAIAAAHASSSAIRGSTRSEASRLARFVQQLERLQRWSVAHVGRDEIRMEMEGDHATALMLTMRLGQQGEVSEALVQFFSEHHAATDSRMVKLTVCASMTEALQNDLNGFVRTVNAQPADVVRRVSVAWTRLCQVLALVARLRSAHPTELRVEKETILVRSSVLLEATRTKVDVQAQCSIADLLDVRSPLFAPANVSVHRVYGHTGASAALHARLTDALLQHDGHALPDGIAHAIAAMGSRRAALSVM